MEEVEPNGLSLSLDDLINKNRSDQKRPRSSGGPRRGGFQQHDGPPRGSQERRYDDRPNYGGDRQYHHGDGGGGRQHYGADRRRPHQGEERRGPRPPPPPPRSSNPAQYRRDQKCFLEEETGTVVFTYKGTELVRITPAGDITLDAAGRYTNYMLASLNDALNTIGIRVTVPSGNVGTGEWSISDGKSLQRYHDGVILPSKGPVHVGRARQMLDAFNDPNRHFAAAATAASNAAASREGLVPHVGVVGPGRPGAPQQRGGVFARLGGGGGGGGGDGGGLGDRERRLQRQGRYNPY